MTAEEKEKVKSLIQEICIPFPLSYRVDSFTFKMCIEELTNIYIEHEELCSIMDELGFSHIRQIKGSNVYHWRLRVKNLPHIPKEFRGRGYQEYKYK